MRHVNVMSYPPGVGPYMVGLYRVITPIIKAIITVFHVAEYITSELDSLFLTFQALSTH